MIDIGDAENAVLEADAQFQEWLEGFMSAWYRPLMEMQVQHLKARLP